MANGLLTSQDMAQSLINSLVRPPQQSPVVTTSLMPTVQPIQPGIDFSGLFASAVSPLDRQALMQREGEALAANVGQLGSAAAYYAPQRAAAMRRGLQGTQRSPEAVVANEIRKLDLNTEEDQKKAVALLSAVNPQAGLALQQNLQSRAAAQQAEIAQQQKDIVARQNAANMILANENIPPETADRFVTAIMGGGDLGNLLEDFANLEVEAAPKLEFTPLNTEARERISNLIDQNPEAVDALGEGLFNLRESGQPPRDKFIQDVHTYLTLKNYQGSPIPEAMAVQHVLNLYRYSENPSTAVDSLVIGLSGGADNFEGITDEGQPTRNEREAQERAQAREEVLNEVYGFQVDPRFQR